VIPLLGPSNPRDTVGYIFDAFLNLTPSYGAPVAWLNGRAIAVPAVDRARDASLDFYLFVRDAYLQRRQAQVAERGPTRRLTPEDEVPAGPGDDFYDVERAEAAPGGAPQQ
jgi:phospholipid-binding lipoprotein MlaA